MARATDDPWAIYTLCCAFCDTPLDTEDAVDPRLEGTDLLCDDCWHARHDFTCAWCEEYDYKEVQHRFVAVYDPDAVKLALPGFYRIDRFPYYTSAMLNAWLEERSLTWLGYLPPDAQPDPDDGDPCGHFCYTCQRRALDHVTFALRCGAAAIL